MKRFVLWMIGVGLFVAALWIGWAFRSGNEAVIDLDLVWVQMSGVAIWRVLLSALALGAFFGGLLFGFAWLRARLLNHRYRGVIRRLESELHQMRSLPLAGGTSEDLEPDADLETAERA